ncbi:chemotaxis protein [Vibrio marisflavi]|uniref:Methyl-accepting chemotaxis protein n=1 Tax=Vibrio marisflavi CECT 7928 TaxID=634439 RepID=A0ABN8E808_9VIBR|nr:chemotaxis protein [Vibrio marisflavi]CAH0539661.1 hypothetical protein VMF7928_02338 [Vibrio marisflavi CECT 7928]
MSDKPVFVVAAEVSAELNRGMQIAKRLLLVASNARALALRAGTSAAGFKPITDSIDELVKITLEISSSINSKAQFASQIATANTRASFALTKFEAVYRQVEAAKYLSTLDGARQKTYEEHQVLTEKFCEEISALHELLKALDSELRVAAIVSTMLRVEASQAEEQFKDQLDTIADSVNELADKVKQHVLKSLTLFSSFRQEEYAIKNTL